MEGRTAGDQEHPAGSAGARQGEGSPSISQRQAAQEASPGRTQDQERGQGFERGHAGQGERSVTQTLLHAKEAGSSGAPRPVPSASAGTCWGQEKRWPGPPYLPGSSRHRQCCSLKQGLFLQSLPPRERQPVGLRPLSEAPATDPSKAPSEHARKGPEQHLSAQGASHSLACGGQHVGCHRAS